MWALVSGGKDSMAMAHVLAARDELEGILHIDTGIAAPDVLPFLKERFGGLLTTVKTPIEYEWFVRKYGFPGPQGHRYAVNYLKGRAIRLFKKSHPNVTLASGIRSRESLRRMGTARAESVLEGMRCVAPIIDWTTEQVWDYIHAEGIDISPAWWNLHISGDCLCGAFARPEEIYLLESFYPILAERIRALEIEREGKPHCRWGNGEGFGQQSRLEAWLCQGCVRRGSP